MQYLTNFAPLNWVPLSITTHWDTLNLYMMLCRNLTVASCVMFTTSMASIHFVNLSIVMNKNLNPPGTLSKIPTMSIPHIAKG
jgi:hypothetical protein